MLFNSFEFLLFFPIVVCFYFLIPARLRQYWLLLASYYFYMSWNAKYGILIMACTVVTYLAGLAIEKQHAAKGTGRWYVAIASTFLILVLAYYKYSWYALYLLSKAFSTTAPSFSVVLPVGVSFYTFQSLGYVIDVYRGEVKAERDFFKYALFISFFPQLVAGPIERSGNLLHQLAWPKQFDFENFREGVVYFIWGFFLKLVIADRAGIYVDYVYNNVGDMAASSIIIATIFFAFQIYGDFGGYSAIAIGAAKILGIDIMENFNAPYYACSVADFWRRWHISLNTWFRDYLYIPLGGNRKGKVRKVINQLIVFGLSGLWHGASITFVMWGLINGLMVITSGIFKGNDKKKQFTIVRIMATFVLVDFTWMFFRAQSLSNLRVIFTKLAEGVHYSSFNEILMPDALSVQNMILLVISIAIAMIIDGFKYKGHSLKNMILESNRYIWSTVCGVTVVLILVFGIWGNAYRASDFIYFQF